MPFVPRSRRTALSSGFRGGWSEEGPCHLVPYEVSLAKSQMARDRRMKPSSRPVPGPSEYEEVESIEYYRPPPMTADRQFFPAWNIVPYHSSLVLLLEPELRVRAEITSHFRIPSSGHLQPLLIRKILDIAVLCLRSCSIVAAESDPNLGAKTHPHDEMIGPSPVKLFLREPLGKRYSQQV